LVRWLIAFVVALAGLSPAFAQSVKTGHAEASIISERAAIAPGDRFMAALKLDIEEGGWHVYWKNPGDSGLPPRIDWTLPEGVAIGDFLWPAPEAVPFGGLMNYGYKSELILPFEITVPAGLAAGSTLELPAKASWLICLEVCIPEEADLVFRVPVAATPQPDDAASTLIGSAIQATPQPLAGSAVVRRTATAFELAAVGEELATIARTATSLRFFPDSQDIQHNADQTPRWGEAGALFTLPISDYAAEGDIPLSGVIVAEDEGGEKRAWSVSAEPGTIPAGVADRPVGGAPAGASFALVSVLIGAFLGGLVLNLMPCVLPVLSIKAASLVRVAHDPAETRAHGLAYTGGVLVCFAIVAAALIGLKALGEQAGLGFQLQYPPVVAFFALVMFAVGLNLLGVFEMGGSLMGVGNNLTQKNGVSGAFFTGLLAGFVGAPCVGPFMAPAVGVALAQPPLVVLGVFLLIGLGMAAPLLALSFAPALARTLPKPGPWMSTFRQALAFPMFLTAIWLLWVLAGQAGNDAVILTIAAATGLGFAIWLAGKIGGGSVGRVVAGALIVAALLGPSLLFGLRPPAPPAQAAVATALAEEAWSPQRVAELRSEGRVVFVDFTARWCVTCQVNERGPLASDAVREAFSSSNVAFLKADWTNRDDIIAEELARHGRAGVPLYLVYPADGGEPEILPQLLTPSLVVAAIKKAAGAVETTDTSNLTGETL
jgi:thiol:disulfide interchange protein/DsbC/DsbD-like thiol-disulfide interchange protein